ncbi:hypothetical protein SAMN05421875_1569, partial [Acidovorax soli]
MPYCNLIASTQSKDSHEKLQAFPDCRYPDAVGHRSLRCRPAHQQRRSRETTGTGQDKTGSKKVVAFKKAIIAAGSQAVRL